jgi:VCBS repeat-containing protein
VSQFDNHGDLSPGTLVATGHIVWSGDVPNGSAVEGSPDPVGSTNPYDFIGGLSFLNMHEVGGSATSWAADWQYDVTSYGGLTLLGVQDGETVVQNYTVTMSDGTNSVDRELSLSFSRPTSEMQIAGDDHASIAIDADHPTASGSVQFTDGISGDTHSAGWGIGLPGGSFATEIVNDHNGAGELQWTYTPDADLVATLLPGQVITGTAAIDIGDWHGGTATENFDITLSGASSLGALQFVDGTSPGAETAVLDGATQSPQHVGQLAVANLNVADSVSYALVGDSAQYFSIDSAGNLSLDAGVTLDFNEWRSTVAAALGGSPTDAQIYAALADGQLSPDQSAAAAQLSAEFAGTPYAATVQVTNSFGVTETQTFFMSLHGSDPTNIRLEGGTGNPTSATTDGHANPVFDNMYGMYGEHATWSDQVVGQLAVDQNGSSSISYSLVGNSAQFFSIDGSGNLALKAGANLDFQAWHSAVETALGGTATDAQIHADLGSGTWANNSGISSDAVTALTSQFDSTPYAVTVRATAADGQSTESTFFLDVRDVWNDLAHMTVQVDSPVSELAPVGTVVATVQGLVPNEPMQPWMSWDQTLHFTQVQTPTGIEIETTRPLDYAAQSHYDFSLGYSMYSPSTGWQYDQIPVPIDVASANLQPADPTQWTWTSSVNDITENSAQAVLIGTVTAPAGFNGTFSLDGNPDNWNWLDQNAFEMRGNQLWYTGSMPLNRMELPQNDPSLHLTLAATWQDGTDTFRWTQPLDIALDHVFQPQQTGGYGQFYSGLTPDQQSQFGYGYVWNGDWNTYDDSYSFALVAGANDSDLFALTTTPWGSNEDVLAPKGILDGSRSVYTVDVDTIATYIDATGTHTIDEGISKIDVNVQQPYPWMLPLTVSLDNELVAITETADSQETKIGDIAFGGNDAAYASAPTLSGDDASFFEVKQNTQGNYELWLKTGAAISYQDHHDLQVSVAAVDAATGNPAIQSFDFAVEPIPQIVSAVLAGAVTGNGTIVSGAIDYSTDSGQPLPITATFVSSDLGSNLTPGEWVSPFDPEYYPGERVGIMTSLTTSQNPDGTQVVTWNYLDELGDALPKNVVVHETWAVTIGDPANGGLVEDVVVAIAGPDHPPVLYQDYVIGQDGWSEVLGQNTASVTASADSGNAAHAVGGVFFDDEHGMVLQQSSVAVTLDIASATDANGNALALTDDQVSVIEADFTIGEDPRWMPTAPPGAYQWQYDASGLSFLTLGDHVVVTADVAVSDGIDSPGHQSFTINIDGAAPPPAVTYADSALTVTGDAPDTSGVIDFADQTPSIPVTAAATFKSSDYSGGALPAGQELGKLTIEGLDYATPGSYADGTIHYGFGSLFSGNPELGPDMTSTDWLQYGQVVHETYAVTVGNDTSGYTEQDVTVTITGAAHDPIAINVDVDVPGRGAQSGHVATATVGTGSAAHADGALAFFDYDNCDIYGVPAAYPAPLDVSASLHMAATDADGTALSFTQDQIAAIETGFSWKVPTGIYGDGIAMGSGHGMQGYDWFYDASALSFLTHGQHVMLTADMIADNGMGGTADQPFTIDIWGQDNAPSVAGANTMTPVTTDGGATYSTPYSGQLAFADADPTDVHTVATDFNFSFNSDYMHAGTGVLGGGYTAPGLELGTLSVSVAQEPGTDGSNGVIDWNYTVDPSKAAMLAEEQYAVETYDVTISDGHGGTLEEWPAFVINGVNAPPEIVGTAPATVVDQDNQQTATGAIQFADQNWIDTHVVSETFLSGSNGETAPIGTMTAAMTADTQHGTGGEIGWNYAVDDNVLAGIPAGQTVHELFDVAVQDNNGAVAHQQVAIDLSHLQLAA